MAPAPSASSYRSVQLFRIGSLRYSNRTTTTSRKAGGLGPAGGRGFPPASFFAGRQSYSLDLPEPSVCPLPMNLLLVLVLVLGLHWWSVGLRFRGRERAFTNLALQTAGRYRPTTS